MNRPQGAVCAYDRGCEFCEKQMQKWRTKIRQDIQYMSLQDAVDREYLEDSKETFESVHVIFPDGSTIRAAGAVLYLLSSTWYGRLTYWSYKYLPGFAWTAEKMYTMIATRRHRL